MKPILEYKGYVGSAEVDLENGLIHGRLLFINDVISYVSDSPKDIEAAFKEAVDDYLETCIECGDAPEVPCKGSLNVRLGSEVHRAAAMAAEKTGVKLNDWIKAACQEKLKATDSSSVTHHHHHDGEMTLRLVVGDGDVVDQFESENKWTHQITHH